LFSSGAKKRRKRLRRGKRGGNGGKQAKDSIFCEKEKKKRGLIDGAERHRGHGCFVGEWEKKQKLSRGKTNCDVGLASEKRKKREGADHRLFVHAAKKKEFREELVTNFWQGGRADDAVYDSKGREREGREKERRG